VADDEVALAVAVEIADGDPRGGVHRLEARRRAEGPRAVAEKDINAAARDG
jgi:hypothetical protein